MKNLTKKTKAVIYIRVSSDEQVDGTSLNDQERKCRQYCKDRGFEVADLFRDEGASAKTANRVEFLRALEFCRKHQDAIEAFVVVKVDRFARNTEDHFRVRKTLLDYGVTLHSVTEPIGNDPVEKLIETVLAGTAEFDNSIRSQRCTDGMIAKLREGICPWQPPCGYKKLGAKKRGEKKRQPDPIDPEIFPMIQRALKTFKSGTFTQKEIGTMLDEWGLAKIRGKKTTKQFVEAILGRNLKFYAGIIVNPWVENEEVKGLHKPMISEEEMFEIMAVKSGRKKKAKKCKRDNPEFPLKSTLKCSSCGYHLTGSFSRGNGGKYPYYHCRYDGCEFAWKSVSKSALEAEFRARLREINPNRSFIALFQDTVLDLWSEKRDHFEVDAKKYERHLKQLDEKRNRIFDMREDGSYTKEEFMERKSEIENELIAAKISLSETRIEPFDIEAALSYAIQFMDDLERQWADLPHPARLRFQQLVFPEGIAYTRGVGLGTARMSLILETKETFQIGKSLVVDPMGFEPMISSMPWKRDSQLRQGPRIVRYEKNTRDKEKGQTISELVELIFF